MITSPRLTGRMLIGACTLVAWLSLTGPAASQTNGAYPYASRPVTPLSGNGGVGFSGRLISYPLGYNPIPSLPYFPGPNYTYTSRGSFTGQSAMPASGNFSPPVSSSNIFAPYYGSPVGSRLSSNGTNGSVDVNDSTGSLGAVSFIAPPASSSASTAATPNQTGELGGPGSATIVIGNADSGSRASPEYNLNALRAVGAALRVASLPEVTPLQPRADLQQVIARSSALPSKDSIQVLTDGPSVILRGTAASENERRLAEALLRLTPGIRDIRNDLTIKTTSGLPNSS